MDISSWLWKTLPIEIINLILEYDTLIKLRNGKYMNQICNVDTIYHLIQKSLSFKKHSKIYRSTYICIVDIYIPNTIKSLYYIAIEDGLRITLHIDDDVKKYHDVDILYSNIT